MTLYPAHRVLQCLAVIAVLVACRGTEAATTAIDLQIAPVRTQVVAHRDLAMYCNAPGQIDGCTVLLGPRLICRCTRQGDAYHLRASAQLVPYVYITGTRVERHEAAHLNDLRAQIESWFDDLAAREFESAEECRAVGDFESAVFGLRMDVFRKKSNERLH